MPDFQTIPQMFLEITTRFKNESRPVYKRKIDGVYQGVSYSELRERVECFAFGLLELGIESGDRVGI